MDTISYEDFTKVNLRVGVVNAAERVPKSDKLLKLEVTFGESGTRVILAGVGKQFTPEEMVGKHVVAVLNLAPRKMMGIESHGMLLAAHSDDALHLVTCTAAAGSEVG